MHVTREQRDFAAPNFCAEVLEPRELLSASLVRDLNVNQASSTIDPMGSLGKLAIYVEDDGSHGIEPYRTDGTAAGTFMLKDIVPGAGSSDPKLLGNANGLMFFTASDGKSRVLWRTDGTVKGTFKIDSPKVQGPNTARADFEDIGNGPCLIYETTGGDLWRSNGTAGGTFELSHGNVSKSFTSVMASFGPYVYFVGSDSAHGTELWRTDGTPAGTTLFADLVSGKESSNPHDFAATSDRLYFNDAIATNPKQHLWKTDGAAVKLIETAGSIDQLNPIGNVLYFVENDGGELWETTSAAASLRKVGQYVGLRIIPRYSNGDALNHLYLQTTGVIGGPSGNAIYSVSGHTATLVDSGIQDTNRYAARQLGNDLYFVQTSTQNSVLVTDVFHSSGGTAQLLKQVNSFVYDFLPIGKHAFFDVQNFDPAHTVTIWKTDGTPSGTAPLTDIHLASPDNDPIARNKPILAADRFYIPIGALVPGTEMWVSDGTANGTHITGDVYRVTLDSNPEGFTRGPGGIYFTTLRAGIWIRHDDTGAVERLIPSDQSGGIIYFASLGDIELISNAEHVWSTDGTKTGTHLIFTTPRIHDVGRLTSVGDIAYFNADQSLWKTDGTEGGTSKISDVRIVGKPISFKRTLMFAALDPQTNQNGLYRSDGTAQSTHVVAPLTDPYTGPNLTIFNGVAYYMDGALNQDGRSLYMTDGTAAGTHLVESGFHRDDLIAVAGKHIFILSSEATGTSHAADLWVSDGTSGGTKILKQFQENNIDANNLLAVGKRVYFPMRDAAHGFEMWTSTATLGATGLVKDIRPREADSITTIDMATDGKQLYFTADDGVHGPELWKTDGTPFGTNLAVEIHPGSTGGLPQQMFVGGKTLLFSATDAKHGRELWQFTLA